MADTTEQTAPVTDAPVTPAQVQPVVEKPKTIEELQKELDAAKQHALNKEQEAERHFKNLKKYQDEEQKKLDAEKTDLQKEKERAATLEAENKKIKLDLLKQQTASKLGLPEILANRLQGETPEEIEADAKQLLETLPKKPNSTSATNPGGDRQVAESDAERKRRLGIG